METSFIKQPLTTIKLVEMINLKYAQFVDMINELNSIAQYFLDENGFSLSFSVSKGTDQTFLWKFTVRIECTKSKVGNTDIKSYRILRLSQFTNIYNYIKQHTEALKAFEPEFNDLSLERKLDEIADSKSSTKGLLLSSGNDAQASACCSSTSKCADSSKASGEMHESKMYDLIQSMHADTLKNEEETCCICMEAKSNMALQCAHSFCELCIKEWKITSNTCPICRCISDEGDSFVLADKPDYYHIQDEISKSLFQITDGQKELAVTTTRPSNSDEESD